MHARQPESYTTPQRLRPFYPHRASHRLGLIASRAESLSEYLRLAGRPAEAAAAVNLGELARFIGDQLDSECPCTR